MPREEARPPGAWRIGDALFITSRMAPVIASLPGFERARVRAYGSDPNLYYALSAIYRAAIEAPLPSSGSTSGSGESTPPEWMTTEQAATVLGVSTRAVRQMLGDGRLAGYREGRAWRLDRQIVAIAAAGRRT